MKPELKVELQHKQGDFTDRKNSRVSDKWHSALILIDCESETIAIELDIWQGRSNATYYCKVKVSGEVFRHFNLLGDARGGSVSEAVRSAFKEMGITWEGEPTNQEWVELLGTTEVEVIFEAIAKEIGVKRHMTIRAGYQPIYRI